MKAFADDHLNVTHNIVFPFNPLPDKVILGFSNSAANKDNFYDVKNMDKWGYNYLIE